MIPETEQEMVTRDGDLVIRRMRDDPADYGLMVRWLTDDRVTEFYYGRDNPYPYKRVVAQYRPRVVGDDPVRACILVYGGRPIGYIQYYPVADSRDYALEDATGTYAFDMFIGEPQYWNQGVGTRAVSALAEYIFEELKAERVVVDPHVDNPRAVRCYEKAGFRMVKVLLKHELHEGEKRDAWLMVRERDAIREAD